MDARPITPEDLYTLMQGFPGPQILDVRREPAFAAGTDALPGALRRDHEAVGAWAGALDPHRPVVTTCAYGHNVGEGAATALAGLGIAARFLDGGIEGWRGLGLPTAPKPAKPSVWVTRARPKVDRIACPWFIRRFIDPDARFLFVPPAAVARVAAETGGTAFDTPDAPYTHDGPKCSFDAFIERHRPNDPALADLALVVRGADTDAHALHPAAAGLFAASLGFSALFSDDHAQLRALLPLYDAFYVWCRDLGAERHTWTVPA